MIISTLAGFSIAELVDQCKDFCTQQIVNVEDDFDLVCNKTCKLTECKIGCQKWFTFSNILTCSQICERKKSGEPTESVYCNIGCNQALKLYVNKTRSSLGQPSAPYLVGDSLRNDSLVLQWKTSNLDFNITYLVQFKYSQLNSEWIYYRPSKPVKTGQLMITNLMPYTVYKFRIAWFFMDNFKSNEDNSKQFEDLINLGFMRKNSTSNLATKYLNRNQLSQSNENVLSSLDEIEPIFSEESVEIRTLAFGAPSLPPKFESCVALSSTKLLITYRSPEFINGELISYSLNANLLTENALQTNSAETAEHQVVRDLKVIDGEPKSKSMNYVLSGLLPNSFYNISLSLNNKEGNGPAAFIQCKTLNANGKANYKQLFSTRRNQQLVDQQIEIEPKLILATKKLILNKKSTNYADSLEILFRLEDFHYGENFTSLAVHIGKGEVYTADTTNNLRKIDLNGKFRKILSFNSQNAYGNLFATDMPNYSKLISSGLLQVKISSLTVDWLNDKLYFVRRTILNIPRNIKINKPDQRFSSYSNYNELIEILRCNLDGTDLQVVLRFDYGELPIKLRIDPYNGFLFWSTINNYHNHAQLSRMMLEVDEELSTPENDRLIEKFLSNQDMKSLPKLSTSIFRIDLALLNTNHTLSSTNARKIVQSTNDPYSLQFTINSPELKIYYLKQVGSSSSIYSINLDGSEPIDIRLSKVVNSHFKLNLRNLALFNRTFFWTLGNETYCESYHNEESKYYHNMIYMDNKVGDLVGMELMHPQIQQVPVPLNSIHSLQALFLNTDVKIKWQAPEILSETGLGAYRRWTYELCIMEMSSNYTTVLTSELNNINEDEKFLRKRICFDIKDQFCNLGQLKMNTTYLIKVRAVSSAGPGPWSNLFTGRTLSENTGDLMKDEFKRVDHYSPHLLFATEDGLIKSNLIGDNTETLLQTNSIGKNYIKDIAWYKDEVFVSIGNTSIYHYKKNKWTLLSKVNGASTIAIDWLTPKLYLSNDIQQTISRCNLDGSQLETLPLFSNVKELVLDSTTALMYWSTGHSIDVATFNGIHKQKYYQVGLFSEKQISGLTLDYVSNKLYFYVKTFKSSTLYSSNLLNARQIIGGSFDIQLKLISTLDFKNFNQGPLNYYSHKMFWLNRNHQVTITDPLGLNPSTITSLKNVHNLQLVHPSLQPIPVAFKEDETVVQPDSINKKIDISGSSTNFTISWQEVKNVAFGDVFYELILENRERIIELHLNQTSYTYPDPSNSDQLVLPVYRISIRAYTYWSYSKRTVIVLKFNNPSEYSKDIAPQHSKIFYLEPPKRPTLLKINKLDSNLYEITWTSSNVNHLKYLNNENLDEQKTNKQDEDMIAYGVFKKSITSDKWQLVYNGTDTKAKIKFESNELKKTNLIKLIAFNRFGESEPINYNLNPSLDDLDNDSLKTFILLIVFGILITLGIAGTILYYWCKMMSEQSHEKKQLQFADNKELAVLSNYPHSFKQQNINDNQLYQRTEFNDLSCLNGVKQVSRSQVEMKNFIGSGAFADVFEGVARFDHGVEKVAVKLLKDKSKKRELFKEALTMNNFDHKHVLKFKGICVNNDPMFLLIELMNRKDLAYYLRTSRPCGARPSPLNLSDLIEISIQLADGCNYLEQKNYIHRDLAARNCLVNIDKDGRMVKIGDFGLTRDMYKGDYYFAGDNAMLPIRWMAIESLNGGKFSTQSDVWSFAVLLWEIFTLGRRPYEDVENKQIPPFLISGNRLQKPDTCPDELFELMIRCWNENPRERPSFSYCHSKLLEIRDYIHTYFKQQPITSVHNQSYILNSGSLISSNQATSAETMQTTQSTVLLCSSYSYREPHTAHIADVQNLCVIPVDHVNKSLENSRFSHYDSPISCSASVNNNNNYVNSASNCFKDSQGYLLAKNI